MSTASNTSSSLVTSEPDVVVLDIGGGYVRAGWAGEDTPRCIVPAVVAHLHTQSGPTMVSEVTLYGNDAIAALQLSIEASGKQTLNVIRPIERGVVKDFDALELLWEYVIRVRLGVSDTSAVAVILAVPPSIRPDAREILASRLFKSLGSPAICLCNSSTLALYSTGRTTGLVVDVGEGLTTVVPVFEGFALKHALKTLDVAGADVTQCMLHQLAKQGYTFQHSAVSHISSSGSSSSSFGGDASRNLLNDPSSTTNSAIASANVSPVSPEEIVRLIKEKLCYVSSAEAAAEPGFGDTPGVEEEEETRARGDRSSPEENDTKTGQQSADFELPDGRIITIRENIRATPAEVLFKPELLGKFLPATACAVPSSLFTVHDYTSVGTSSALASLYDGPSGLSSRPGTSGDASAGASGYMHRPRGSSSSTSLLSSVSTSSASPFTDRLGSAPGSAHGGRAAASAHHIGQFDSSHPPPVLHGPLPLSLAALNPSSAAAQLVAYSTAKRIGTHK